MTLNKIRQSSKNILFKILLVFIAISFAAWGLGDLFTKPSNTIATVDNEPILINEHMNAINLEKQRIRAILNQEPSEELLKQFNVEESALSKLIQQKLVELHIKDLDLKIKDELVIKDIKQNHNFYGDDGQFDKEKFFNILSANHITEASYIDTLKKDKAAKLLHDSLTSIPLKNDIFKNILQKYVSEIADIKLIIFGRQKSKPTINEKEIEEFYEKNQTIFKTPEYRDIEYFCFAIDKIAERLSIDEDELKKEFEDNIDEYLIPEKRKIISFTFDNFDKANEAYKILNNNDDFSQAITKIKNFNSQISEQIITHNDFTNDIAEIIFSLNKGQISSPKNTKLGILIFKVIDIIPAKKPDFAAIKDKIRNNIAKEKAEKEFFNLAEKIDEDFASGLNFEEIANKYKFAINKINDISEEGFSKEGLKKNLPDLDNFLTNAFKYKKDIESPLIASNNDTIYYVTKTVAITPPSYKNLEQVRKEIIETLEAQKVSNEVAIIANKFYHDYNQNHDIESTLKNLQQHNISIIDNFKTTRVGTITENIYNLQNDIISEIFTLEKNNITKPKAIDANKYAIAYLNNITLPDKIENKLAAKIDKEIAEDNYNSIMEEFLHYLNVKFKVELYNKRSKS